MDGWQSTPFEEDLSYLIALVSLALVPAMLLWWLIAQFVNRQLGEAGRQDLIGGLWYVLRFGPLAPLISAAAFLCGLLPVSVWIWDVSPTYRIPLLMLTASGLVAFMTSMVLWSYSNAPPHVRSAAD